MADEAFALSPISARAALPSEADYDAIREAFMETSRGRWFLTEYAKRNRNADTTMVLDAVARIEQTLAAQKQATADDGLAKAIAAIRNSLEEARAAAKALAAPSMDDAIAPMQKGVRIIREISWRWREIGGDGRICDLLDSQATAIEGASAQLAARDDTSAFEAAFGLIEATLDDLSGSTTAAAHAPPAATASSSATTRDEAPVSPVALAPEHPIVAAETAELPIETTPVSEARADVPEETATSDQGEDTIAATDDEDMAHDDAVLDMIALEMGAPDFDESEMDDVGAPAAVSTEPETASEPQIIAESADASIAPEAVVEAQSSLGASLLASGIITRTPPRSDPLAPIRRMTQAEKIAFFS
ncbi:MAG: hypothetical protein ACTHN2_03470 [Nitrobacter sp.]